MFFFFGKNAVFINSEKIYFNKVFSKNSQLLEKATSAF